MKKSKKYSIQNCKSIGSWIGNSIGFEKIQKKNAVWYTATSTLVCLLVISCTREAAVGLKQTIVKIESNGREKKTERCRNREK
jgi:hypothetical protein